MPSVVTALNRYPVKSCRGEPLDTAVVEPWGLAGDRRFMLVDADGSVVTARENPSLVLVTPSVGGQLLRLDHPGATSLTVTVPDGSDLVPVQMWNSKLDAAPVGASADDWFSQVVGHPVRLVYLDDPQRRRPNPRYGKDSDRVSLADGYPLLLTTESSLAALNDLIRERTQAQSEPMSMTRFRPNVVVAGTPAWVEDGWRRLRIGAVHFRAVKACDRCVFTTIDPVTAQKGTEPIATLARYRKWDGKTWFGVNLIPDEPEGASIAVGDPVEVIAETDASEPQR
ncbi:MAG: MOSC N-terminal beta barrel domain-containing protein [Actinomycetota bacterium]